MGESFLVRLFGAMGISPLVALEKEKEKGPQLLRTELAY